MFILMFIHYLDIYLNLEEPYSEGDVWSMGIKLCVSVLYTLT